MIIATQGSELRLVTQNDHAAWASELLALWRADGLPEHPRREALLLATREHDTGWLEADSAPHRTSDGRPHDFLSLPSELRLEIWNRGIDRLREQETPTRRYAAALIAHHALELHQGSPADSTTQFAEARAQSLEDWRQQRDTWLADADVDTDQMTSDYAFLRLADRLSLAVCADWAEPGTVGGAGVEQRTFHIDRDDSDVVVLHLQPFPLAGATTFAIAFRQIDDQAHKSGVDLAMAVTAARWRRLRVRVAP